MASQSRLHGHRKAGAIFLLIVFGTGLFSGIVAFYVPNTIKPPFLPRDCNIFALTCDDLYYSFVNFESQVAPAAQSVSDASASLPAVITSAASPEQIQQFVSGSTGTIANATSPVSSPTSSTVGTTITPAPSTDTTPTATASDLGQTFSNFADQHGIDSSQSFVTEVDTVAAPDNSGTTGGQIILKDGWVMSALLISPLYSFGGSSKSPSYTGSTSFAYSAPSRSFTVSQPIAPSLSSTPSTPFAPSTTPPAPPPASALQKGQVYGFQNGHWTAQSYNPTAQAAKKGAVWSFGTRQSNQIPPALVPPTFSGSAPNNIRIVTTNAVSNNLAKQIQQSNFAGFAQAFTNALGSGLLRYQPAQLTSAQQPHAAIIPTLAVREELML